MEYGKELEKEIKRHATSATYLASVCMPRSASYTTQQVQLIVREDVAVGTAFSGGLPSDALCRFAGDGVTKPTAPTQPQRHSQDSFWPLDAYYSVGDICFLHTDRIADIVRPMRADDWWVEVQHITRWPQFDGTTPPDELPGLALHEKELLRAASGKAWGQIVVTPDAKRDMIVALVQFFGNENVLVVAKNDQSVKRIARQLRQRTDRRVSTGIEVRRSTEPIVHIDSYSGLCRTAHDWHVLIFADFESARSDTGMQQAASMPESVIYAIIPIDQRIDDEDQLRLRVTCGPEIYRLTDEPFTGTTVTVLPVRAHRLRARSPCNPLTRKRCHIWGHRQRNQQIAEFAEAFASGDRDRLRSCGIPVDEIEAQFKDIGEQPRVAIIVESQEHARALRQVLRGWRLATGARLDSKCWPKFPLDEPRVIITQMRAQAIGLAADVVILADGASHAWRDAYGPHYGFTGAGMLVVDMQDTFDAFARDAVRHRMADYRARRWNITATPIRSADQTSARQTVPAGR